MNTDEDDYTGESGPYADWLVCLCSFAVITGLFGVLTWLVWTYAPNFPASESAVFVDGESLQ